MVDVKFGERRSYEFEDLDGTPAPIVDFFYLTSPPITEKSGVKDVINKEVLLTLHSDNSFAMSTIESGQRLIWYDFHESHLTSDDTIVDIMPSGSKDDLFFVVLTKKGKILLFHYTLIDSKVNMKKYINHLKGYDRGLHTICRDRLRKSFNDVCLGEDFSKGLDKELKTGLENRFISIVDVEVVELPGLIQIETKVPVAPFNLELTEFKHIQVVNAQKNMVFAATDNTGCITMLVKNLRLKARIHSEGDNIIATRA